MMNMLYRATKYMNFEDAMIAQVGKLKKRERQDNPRPNGGRKSEKWQKGRQEFKTSFQKDDQLHPTEHPAQVGPHASKWWLSTQVARQVEKWS